MSEASAILAGLATLVVAGIDFAMTGRFRCGWHTSLGGMRCDTLVVIPDAARDPVRGELGLVADVRAGVPPLLLGHHEASIRGVTRERSLVRVVECIW